MIGPLTGDRVRLFLFRLYRRLPAKLRVFLVRRATPSFSVGAMCVLRADDGALLLVANSYRGGWGLPGGLLRRGESAEAAVHREVREEVGVEIEVLGPPDVVVDPKARRVDVVFCARPVSAEQGSGAAAASPEVTEASWFPADRLPALQKETAAAVKLALDRPAAGGASRPGGRP